MFLDLIKHVLRDFEQLQKCVSWESEQRFKFSEGKILAYKKNKNTNEECFIRCKAHARDALSVF